MPTASLPSFLRDSFYPFLLSSLLCFPSSCPNLLLLFLPAKKSNLLFFFSTSTAALVAALLPRQHEQQKLPCCSVCSYQNNCSRFRILVRVELDDRPRFDTFIVYRVLQALAFF